LRTFTINELEYLEKLLDRNLRKDYKGSKHAPLEIPMNPKERQIRARLRKKVQTYLSDMPYFILAGVNIKNIHKYKDGDDDHLDGTLQYEFIEPLLLGVEDLRKYCERKRDR
jgi:hypothetical protein